MQQCCWRLELSGVSRPRATAKTLEGWPIFLATKNRGLGEDGRMEEKDHSTDYAAGALAIGYCESDRFCFQCNIWEISGVTDSRYIVDL
jgi:hypothetical protein